MSEYAPLDQVLGPEIYFSENVEGMEGFQGFGELGEPVTLTSVAAAMGVIAGIVAALKQIGDVFKKKQPGSEDFDESRTDAPENNVTTSATNTTVPTQNQEAVISPTPEDIQIQKSSTVPSVTVEPASQSFENNSSQEFTPPVNNTIVKSSSYSIPSVEDEGIADEGEDVNTKSSPGDITPTTNNKPATNNIGTNNNNDKESFWGKNKTWLKPVAYGVGGLTLITIAFKMMSGDKHQNKSSPEPQNLSGTPNKQKKKNKPKHQQKKAVALI
jgi:hypothetical protein